MRVYVADVDKAYKDGRRILGTNRDYAIRCSSSCRGGRLDKPLGFAFINEQGRFLGENVILELREKGILDEQNFVNK